jgi:hypothetical protein
MYNNLLGVNPYTAFHSGIPVLYTADAYRNHDWCALSAQFEEACDSFIPSAFLIGEDITEYGIFVDALKAVIQPTTAIRTFIKYGKKFIKGFETKSLGHVARHLGKNGSNAFLSYNFGVKPAIKDIVDALEAHKVVSSRMRYLRENAGDFVPIRVRKKLTSEFLNTPPSNASSWGRCIICNNKQTVATISAWGKVREDLNFGDTWSAYLQRFGVNQIVGLAWELIPFSFVVDWFTNTQEHIKKLTRLHTGGPFTEFRGMCASVKTSLQEDLLAIPPVYLTSLDPFVVASKVSTEYKRFLEIPEDSNFLDFSNLGSFHLAATGSLILQRVT